MIITVVTTYLHASGYRVCIAYIAIVNYHPPPPAVGSTVADVA